MKNVAFFRWVCLDVNDARCWGMMSIFLPKDLACIFRFLCILGGQAARLLTHPLIIHHDHDHDHHHLLFLFLLLLLLLARVSMATRRTVWLKSFEIWQTKVIHFLRFHVCTSSALAGSKDQIWRYFYAFEPYAHFSKIRYHWISWLKSSYFKASYWIL